MTEFTLTPSLFRTLREAYDLSQKKLAEKLGVDRRTIIRWESAGPIPPMACMAMLHLGDRIQIPLLRYVEITAEEERLGNKHPELLELLRAATAAAGGGRVRPHWFITRVAHRLKLAGLPTDEANNACRAAYDGNRERLFAILPTLAAQVAQMRGYDPDAAQYAMAAFIDFIRDQMWKAGNG